ncbi:tyrosinase family protein [Granulicella arctica]|uniref:tyrosinase family protein n=1 Tax=Granulicella arctica TaxID=940613 RepID=UPI0021DFD2C2|nr:tyrosinase family protein [Granulicella arctica]
MSIRVRRSLTELQDEYMKDNKKPLETVMRAWKGIKELSPDDPHAFFTIGGYHGEPFRGGGWGSNAYWGGYCNHGNVLFPTWHRIYLLKLEKALQSIPGCKEVMLPYWDETSPESLANGIPWALTADTFVLDGVSIPNPLKSFVFNRSITDNLSTDTGDANDPNYSKPMGYETVRYPLSGLVGSSAEQAATTAHNALYPDYNKNVDILNQNVVAWLSQKVVVGGQSFTPNVHQNYIDCLDAPNYMLFSNYTSSGQWNNDHNTTIVSLESPHDDIHLAIGGFDAGTSGDFSPIAGANADMGENDTAGLDPIFFFHHCFVDYVFWRWQVKHGVTKSFGIDIPEYPGTNTVDSQGPTPGVAPNTWLTMESPLAPFTKSAGKFYTSLDSIDIEGQLGYTYSPASLDTVSQPVAAAAALAKTVPAKALHVSGLNRSRIRGSFVIAAYAEVDGKKVLLGNHGILSRWNVQGCMNCQTHLETKASISLHGLADTALSKATFSVEVRTREQAKPAGLVAKTKQEKPFLRFEVR